MITFLFSVILFCLESSNSHPRISYSITTWIWKRVKLSAFLCVLFENWRTFAFYPPLDTNWKFSINDSRFIPQPPHAPFHPSPILYCFLLDTRRERMCSDRRSVISISSRFRSFSFRTVFRIIVKYLTKFFFWFSIHSIVKVLNMIFSSIFHSQIALGVLSFHPAWCDKLWGNFFISFNASFWAFSVRYFFVFVPNNIFLWNIHILHSSSQKLFSQVFPQIINSFQVVHIQFENSPPQSPNKTSNHRI